MCWLWRKTKISKTVYFIRGPQVRISGFRNLENFSFWNPESWALESGIPLTIRVRIQSSTDKDLVGISGIHSVESRIQDCLGERQKHTHTTFAWRYIWNTNLVMIANFPHSTGNSIFFKFLILKFFLFHCLTWWQMVQWLQQPFVVIFMTEILWRTLCELS